MLGLGSLGTAVLLAGLIIVVIVVAVTNLLGGLIAALPLALLMLMVVVRDKHGLNASDKVVERVAWLRQRSRREHLYRSGLWVVHRGGLSSCRDWLRRRACRSSRTLTAARSHWSRFPPRERSAWCWGVTRTGLP
jgi:hypothetical protein